jgi:hypothetical protein
VECEMVGVIREWSIMGARRVGGHRYEGRRRSCNVRERLGVEVGVRISLGES